VGEVAAGFDWLQRRDGVAVLAPADFVAQLMQTVILKKRRLPQVHW